MFWVNLRCLHECNCIHFRLNLQQTGNTSEYLDYILLCSHGYMHVKYFPLICAEFITRKNGNNFDGQARCYYGQVKFVKLVIENAQRASAILVDLSNPDQGCC